MNDKVEYWLDLCDDDLITAKWLLEGGRLLHCGYFCHQIAEKAFKAAVAKRTSAIPPKIHDLPKLANLAGLWDMLSDGRKELLKTLIPLQVKARYPEYKERIASTLSVELCKKTLSETEELLCWIKQQLGK